MRTYTLIFVAMVIALSLTHIETKEVVSAWAKDIFKKTNKANTCKKTREMGGKKPTEKDAPSAVWGTPISNFDKRVTIIRPTPEITSNVVIGTKDFTFVGTVDELLAFCACYENTRITGKSLQPDMKWKENTGEIKIQLQDASKFKGNESPFDILFKFTLDKITAYLNPNKIIGGQAMDINDEVLKSAGIYGASTAKEIVSGVKKVSEYIPGINEKSLITIISKKESLAAKGKDVIDYIRKEDDKIDNKWVGIKNINKKKRVVVVLAMYTKQELNVRATYNMNKASTTFLEVGKVLKDFFRY